LDLLEGLVLKLNLQQQQQQDLMDKEEQLMLKIKWFQQFNLKEPQKV
jgi:hypothetical protein